MSHDAYPDPSEKTLTLTGKEVTALHHIEQVRHMYDLLYKKRAVPRDKDGKDSHIGWQHELDDQLQVLEELGIEVRKIDSQSLAEQTKTALQRGFSRYEKLRKLSPHQFAELHAKNLGGQHFDDLVDAL